MKCLYLYAVVIQLVQEICNKLAVHLKCTLIRYPLASLSITLFGIHGRNVGSTYKRLAVDFTFKLVHLESADSAR